MIYGNAQIKLEKEFQVVGVNNININVSLIYHCNISNANIATNKIETMLMSL